MPATTANPIGIERIGANLAFRFSWANRWSNPNAPLARLCRAGHVGGMWKALIIALVFGLAACGVSSSGVHNIGQGYAVVTTGKTTGDGGADVIQAAALEATDYCAGRGKAAHTETVETFVSGLAQRDLTVRHQFTCQ